MIVVKEPGSVIIVRDIPQPVVVVKKPQAALVVVRSSIPRLVAISPSRGPQGPIGLSVKGDPGPQGVPGPQGPIGDVAELPVDPELIFLNSLV